MNKKLTIGLFGTCGSSRWREPFIHAIQQTKTATYFNPQLPEGTWTPECADIENQHFLTDDIILFPITSETTAFGSLGEVGFSVESLISNPSVNRFFIFMIDDECLDDNASPEQAKDSIRMRVLVKSKLIDIKHPNIFTVHTLDEMNELMFDLIDMSLQFKTIRSKFG